MNKRKPLTDADGEVRELTIGNLKHAMRFEQLPMDVKSVLRTRGPQKAPTKEAISIRFSPEVLDGFRSMGQGWQSKMDEVLKDFLRTKKPA